jgi:hypothetical protein
LETFATELEQATSPLPRRVNADPGGVERGLAKLVLTLDEEIEWLGQTFLKLDMRMEELKQIFDLENEDLNLHLGPPR